MKKTILVTDTLFIFPEHEELLREAGFEVERLPKPDASEEELIKAVKGKVGYILGGVEKVTDLVIEAADELKAMVFAGSSWTFFIPGHELATKKGILICNAPGANSFSVAEYTLALILVMLRRVLELGGPGKESFKTTASIADAEIGIMGMGKIGEQVARLLKGCGAPKISYWNRTRKPELERELGITYKSLEILVKESNLVTNHVSDPAGTLVDEALLRQAKDDVILINTGGHHAFDLDAVYNLLDKGRGRAAYDVDSFTDNRFAKLPVWNWYITNNNAGYNTHAANKLASDMAVESLINLINNGDDQHRVNK